jgi:hypothetical protein
MDALKLVALDREDIEVVSAHLQDAVVNATDICWRQAEKRVVVGLNRFDWEAAIAGGPTLRRRRAALRFDRVKNCRCRNVDVVGRGDFLNLLAVEFAETDAPAGVVTLTFSGDAALRLEVECLEVELADLGPVWSAMPTRLDSKSADFPGQFATLLAAKREAALVVVKSVV